MIIALAYIGFGLLLYLMQGYLLYRPTPETPNGKYHSFRLEVDAASLKIWQTNPGNDQAIIYFGGNAEDVYNSMEHLEEIFLDHTVYAVNYRRYGGSTGSPSEKNLFKDALSVYDHIKSKHRSVSAMGRSLGSGVAVHLAVHRDVSKLALVTPYDSVTNVAQRVYPAYPVSWLLRDPYNSHGMAGRLTSPTLVLIAGQDTIIPPAHGHKLAAAIPARLLRKLTIANAGHNDISASADYPRYLRGFFNTTKK